MAKEHLYSDRAALYDLIYHWKDYDKEAERLKALLAERGVGPGSRVLEGAVGTGNHMARLRSTYEVAGFDLHEGMLSIAREKLSGAALWQADLRDFSAERPFDAFLCLFSSIGYLLGEAELSRAARAIAAAVRPGGVVIIEPWLTVEVIDNGRPSLQTYQSPDLQIARGTTLFVRDQIAETRMHYMVVRRGQPVEYFVEEHLLWCAPTTALLSVFDEAGFDVEFLDDGLMPGRGLLIGVRRTSL